MNGGSKTFSTCVLFLVFFLSTNYLVYFGSKLDVDSTKFRASRNRTITYPAVSINFQDVHLKINIMHMPKNFEETCKFKGVSTSENETDTEETLLIFVLSSAPNRHIRDAIRAHWANSSNSNYIKDGYTQVYFLLGTGDNSYIELLVEMEQNSDIILIDMEDTYENLIFKTSMILHLGSKVCSSSFILKVDEDVVFHADRFRQFVNTVFIPNSLAIYGFVWYGTRPKRIKSNKWYVSREQYNRRVFPPYCAGPSYVLTHRAALSISNALSRHRLIIVEDVLMTGIIAEDAGVKPVHLPDFFLPEMRIESPCTFVRDGRRSLISVHNAKSPSEIQETWANLKPEC